MWCGLLSFTVEIENGGRGKLARGQSEEEDERRRRRRKKKAKNVLLLALLARSSTSITTVSSPVLLSPPLFHEPSPPRRRYAKRAEDIQSTCSPLQWCREEPEPTKVAAFGGAWGAGPFEKNRTLASRLEEAERAKVSLLAAARSIAPPPRRRPCPTAPGPSTPRAPSRRPPCYHWEPAKSCEGSRGAARRSMVEQRPEAHLLFSSSLSKSNLKICSLSFFFTSITGAETSTPTNQSCRSPPRPSVSTDGKKESEELERRTRTRGRRALNRRRSIVLFLLSPAAIVWAPPEKKQNAHFLSLLSLTPAPLSPNNNNATRTGFPRIGPNREMKKALER